LEPVQLDPRPRLATQLLGLCVVSHQAPLTHMESAVQSLLQITPEHRLYPHETCTGAGQLPAPSHISGSVATPPVQLGARHAVELLGYVHAVRLTPLQLPAQVAPHST
jgi:hypothetical protein